MQHVVCVRPPVGRRRIGTNQCFLIAAACTDPSLSVALETPLPLWSTHIASRYLRTPVMSTASSNPTHPARSRSTSPIQLSSDLGLYRKHRLRSHGAPGLGHRFSLRHLWRGA